MGIREDLQASREKTLILLEGVGEEEFNFRPDEKSWSIAQVLEHIAKVEKGISKVMALGRAQNPNYTAKDLPLEQLLPDRSRKVMAAEPLHPSDEPKTLEEVIYLLNKVRSRLLQTLEEIEEIELLQKTSPPVDHPVFGRMSTWQWLLSVPLHDERHIGQIEELKKAYAERSTVGY